MLPIVLNIDQVYYFSLTTCINTGIFLLFSQLIT
jgi:hypothetical protein